MAEVDEKASPADVGTWLDGLGLSTYRETFLANDVDAGTLPLLTTQDLRDLGVTSIGHRRRLLDAISRLMAAGISPEDRGRDADAFDPPAGLHEASPPTWPVRPKAAGRSETVPAERRQVTMLFSDLVGFTRLATRFDPEVTHDILSTYKDACVEVIERFGGHVVRFLGDGVLATFGYPRAHEDDAARAVGAGLEIAVAVGALATPDGDGLAARVGIATGLVVAGDLVGGVAVEQDSLVGEAPNLAARLQAEAEPGQVLIAGTTAAIIGARFVCEPLVERTPKGFATPVEVFRVVEQRRSASRFEAARRPGGTAAMINREEELARLLACGAAAAGGHGQLVHVVGEAGIGKSRLVDELLRRLHAPEPLWLQCSPHHTNTPFHPVRLHLEYAAGIAAADSAAVRLGKVGSLLEGLGPMTAERLALVAELLRIKAGAVGAPLDRLGAGEIRARTVAVLLDVIEVAARRCSVMVVEDAHWLDPSTAELLGRLAGSVREWPVMIVTTTRPADLPAWAGGPDATVVHLDRLGADEIRRLVDGVGGAGRLLPASVVDTIAERSDGIPIFAEELARSLLSEAAAPGGKRADRQAIPVTLNETLVARLDRLEHGRETAQLAAVIGREFPADLLVAASPLAPAATRAGIGRLLEAGIFVGRRSILGEAIGFRHALVRDAAYSLILHRDRVRLHRLVADTIETRFPAIADALPHILAHQLTEAGDYGRAIIHWERAGLDAARRSAAREAVAHLTRAIELTSRLPQGRERDNRELGLRLATIGPLIAVRGYSSADVEKEMDRAVELCGRTGSADRLVPALTHKWLAMLGSDDMNGRHELSRQIAEAAVLGGTVDRLVAHRVMGSTLLFRGEFAAAAAEFEAFLALYDPGLHDEPLSRVGATNHAVTVKLCLAEAATLMGEAVRAARWRAAALDAARADGHFQTLCQTIAFGGGLLAELAGDPDEVAAHAAELRRLTVEHALPFWRGHADLLAGLADIGRAVRAGGDVEPGFRLARGGLDALLAGRAFLLAAWCVLYAAACAKDGGRHEEGLAVLAAAEPRVRGGERWMAAEFHRIRGLLRLRQGGVPDGLADLAEAASIARAQGSPLFEARATAELARSGSGRADI